MENEDKKNDLTKILYQLVAAIIVALTCTLLFSRRSIEDSMSNISKETQVFSDFIQGKPVPLTDAMWITQGFPNQNDVKIYCLQLGIYDQTDLIWERIRSPLDYQLVFAGEPFNLEELIIQSSN